MKLGLTKTSVGASPPWLDSTEGVRFLTGGVTINSAAATIPAADANGRQIVKSGTPIKLVGAKWEPDFAGVGAAPTALLWEDLDVTDSDSHGGAIDHARVRTAALPVVLHADAQASLRTVGITFRA